MKVSSVAVIAACAAVAVEGADVAVLKQKIQAIVDDCKVRGAAVALLDKSIMSEPFLGGFGYVSADNGAQAVTKDTAFMIASVSKVFAGVSVMKLIEDGFISSEQDDICEVLPDNYDASACRNPNFESVPVTWAHIMTHTASMLNGVPDDFDGQPGYGPTGGYDGSAIGNPSCPLEDVIGFYRDLMTDTDPNGSGYTQVGNIGHSADWHDLASVFDDEEIGVQGSAWLETEAPGTFEHYSNLAIGYIAALAEHALGGQKSYPDYCKEKIFQPLGMTNTAWFRRDLPAGILEAEPTIYDDFEDSWIRGSEHPTEDHYCFIDYTSGQLHTTVADLSKFLDAHLNNYGAGTLYNSAENGKKTLNKLNSVSAHGFCWVAISNEDKSSAEGWYQLATDLDWTNGGEHTGGELGVETYMGVLPESGVYAVVLLNTEGTTCDATEEIMTEFMNYRKTADTGTKSPGSAPSSPGSAPSSVAPQNPRSWPIISLWTVFWTVLMLAE